MVYMLNVFFKGNHVILNGFQLTPIV